MRRLWNTFVLLFEHPVKLSFVALALAFVSLLTEGTLLELWNLNAEANKLSYKLHEAQAYNGLIQRKIEQARTSDKFIGKQAREKLDLVKDDELVFIFENEPTSEPQRTPL